MHGASGFRIERERELLLPVEFVAGVAERVIAIAGAGTSSGDIGGVGGNLVGNDAVFHVFLIGQPEMLFRRDITKHRSAVPSNHGCTDG